MSSLSPDILSFSGVDFEYPGYPPVIKGFSAGLKEGEIVCVTGASGCGKSTLLNLAGGFLLPGSGVITDRHGQVSAPSPSRVMVFQDSAQLFTWLTVRNNVLFPFHALTDRKEKKSGHADAGKRAESLLEIVGLSDAADLYPAQLSGGMKQRAVIARALASDPEILLLDEPFTALDAPTRRGLQDLLLDLNSRLGTSMLFVTHDIREAVYLADRVLIITEKGVEQLEVGLERGPGKRDEFSDEFVRIERRIFAAIQS